MNFADRLIDQINEKGAPICVGIDPNLERIPESVIEQVTQGGELDLPTIGTIFLEFGKGIIDAVADLVPAVKLQMAYYEQYGVAGMYAFAQTCTYAKSKGLIVIADGKRNDIGSTAEAYAKAYLGEVEIGDTQHSIYDIDALTVTPYLGFDGIKPFIEECEKHNKGIFILVKTSNPSAGDFQDRVTDEGLRNFEYIAHFVESWGADVIGEHGFSSIGAVVGATYPKDIAKLRKLMPTSFFLVPGYGAQGADAEDLKAAFGEDGIGALINASRSIIYAYEDYDELDYKEAARAAVIEMREELKSV